MYFQDTEQTVTFTRRTLVNETSALELITASLGPLMSHYKVVDFDISEYPNKIKVYCKDEDGESPDEDIGAYLDYDVASKVFRELEKELGCVRVCFPYYYWSK